MQYSFSPCPLLSKLLDLRMYLIAAVSAVIQLGSLTSTEEARINTLAEINRYKSTVPIITKRSLIFS